MIQRPGIDKVLPDRYLEVSKAILTDSRSRFSFGKGQPQKRILRPYFHRPNEVWPGLLSTDPGFVQFKSQFARIASRDFPVSVDADGFSTTGITRDFSALLSCSGVKMSRANAPFSSRELVFRDLGIQNRYKNERHQRIFRAIHRQMFGKRVKDTPYHFSMVSSTSAPFFAFSAPEKQTMIRWLLENAETVLDMVDRDDLDGLRAKFGIVVLSTLVERHQPEGGTGILGPGPFEPKKRMVNDRQRAESGGRTGRLVEASKTDITEGVYGLNDALAMRVRTAYGLCGALSYFLSCFLASSRAHYFEEYGYTWHHSTPDQIKSKLDGMETIIGMDVTTMDQLMPSFLLEEHATLCEDYFDRRVAKLIRWINGAPYYAPQLTYGESPFFMGDPRDANTFKVDVGLSSGRPDNPDLGKWYMTGVYFCLMDDRLGDLLEQAATDDDSIALVLKGQHPVFGLLDMSDDALLGFKAGHKQIGEQLRADLIKAGETKKAGLSPYAILDFEHGAAFLGNVIVRDQLHQLRTPIPNPVTSVVNRHCPEHGVNSVHRQYWGHGYISAIEHYSRAGSIVSELITLQDNLWRRYLPEHPTPRVAALAHMKSHPLPMTAALSAIDLEVLLDPAKRFYKYTMEDLSPEIQGLFSGTVEGEFIEKHIGRYML